jgi:hypothetical protein
VIGYVESATVNDDLYVLSATGTAAILDLRSICQTPTLGAAPLPKSTVAEEQISIDVNNERVLLSKESTRTIEVAATLSSTLPSDETKSIATSWRESSVLLEAKKRTRDRVDWSTWDSREHEFTERRMPRVSCSVQS